MKYLCLVYIPEEDLTRVVGEAGTACPCEGEAWVEELEQRGQHVLTLSLEPVRTAGTVRIRNGSVSAEEQPEPAQREVLGGFSVINARDLNEAIFLASQLPAARAGCVEIRPVLNLRPA